ncbi:DUF159-domain-containing protein [Marasmius fiardii PR-910]|nr:DUF159-domain-containing protein [Marasmius fiardii PR-910]
MTRSQPLPSTITMCGRFAMHLRQRQEIRDRAGYDLDIGEWIDEDQFVPRYNIAPRTRAPVIRRRQDAFTNTEPTDNQGQNASEASTSATKSSTYESDASTSSEFVLHSMKWGLVPHWSKYEDKTLSTTNARSENLVEGGGMWAGIKGKRRCAVVCEGYYEWLTKGKEKLPHFTKHKDGRLMLLAGLYDCVLLEGKTEPLWTFTIVTTSANKDFEWLHERQPVILSTQSALKTWLDTTSQSWTKELSKMVQPYNDPAAPLECYQVPKEVGKVGTESPKFIEPVSKRKDGIEAMFAKQKSLQPKSLQTNSSPTKRKRSPSLPSAHVAKSETVDSDDDVKIAEAPGPSTPKKVKTSSQKPQRSPQKVRIAFQVEHSARKY